MSLQTRTHSWIVLQGKGDSGSITRPIGKIQFPGGGNVIDAGEGMDVRMGFVHQLRGETPGGDLSNFFVVRFLLIIVYVFVEFVMIPVLPS
jgi:hypothetical protein